MNNEALTQKYQALLRDPLEVVKIERCNFKPHPFMIGPQHVAYAADHCGGRLGEEVINKIGCVWQDDKYGPRCGLLGKDHTSDHVLFVKVIRNCTNREAADALYAIKATMLDDKIDGVAFYKSEFEIAPPDKEETHET